MTAPILPMLVVRGEPFDSEEYLFEIKWNGIRALAARQNGEWDLWGRESTDYRPRYPEMAILTALPSGTVLDGELVVLSQGVPDLDAILGRHQLTDFAKILHASKQHPVSYLVFDLLAYQGRSLLGQPLKSRRDLLLYILERNPLPGMHFSAGVVGSGRAFFEQAVGHGQEGVMAKHLSSRYLPGKRSSSWLKVKPRRRLACVIIGWFPGVLGLGGLLVAAPVGGVLRYVATVRTGFTDLERQRLAATLARLGRPSPLIRCPHPALWVEPNLLCEVNYLELTRSGRLRGASFCRLLHDGVPR